MEITELTYVESANEGAWLVVRSPAGEDLVDEKNGQPVRIRLAGSDSDVYRQTERTIRDRRIEAVRKREEWTAKMQDDEALELLSACFLAWEGFYNSGELFECNSANARTLMRKAPFVREQVDDFIGSRVNFTRG